LMLEQIRAGFAREAISVQRGGGHGSFLAEPAG
jgi:hypothetical protein